MKLTLLPLICAGAFACSNPAYAQSSFDAPWEFHHVGNTQSLAKWCAEGGSLGSGFECHTLQCTKGRVEYYITKKPKVKNTKSNAFKILVDGKPVHTGALKIAESYELADDWVGLKPIPQSVQQALAAGNQVTVQRFDGTIQNVLKGSGRAIKQLWRTCGVNIQTASNKVTLTSTSNNLRSDKLDQLCQPYYGLVKYQSSYLTSGLFGFRLHYQNRHGTAESHHDVGLVTIRDINGYFEGSIAYHGADTKGTGFRFRLPSNDLTLTPAIKQDLLKIRNLTLKYFEWKQVAQQNGVTDFRKYFPVELRPSIANRSNFRFTVGKNINGKLLYGLQNMHEHGFCWLYRQIINVEQIFAAAQSSMRAERARENLAKQQQNNLSNKFQ